VTIYAFKERSFYGNIILLLCSFCVLLSLRDFSYFTASSENSEKLRVDADFVPAQAQKLAKFLEIVKVPRKIRFYRP
jgi:hypothetical protein